MEKAMRKNFSAPDEVRKFEKGKLELVDIDGKIVGLFTFQPGWRWSKHVKPLANTQWCEAPHFQYLISGRLHIMMSDGSEFDMEPGDVVNLPSGHDAWVVGDEPAIGIDWQGAVDYAKGSA